MRTLLFAAALATALVPATAQQFKVTSVERVAVSGPQAECFHPVFAPDGKSLYVTSEAYDGLGRIDIATGKYEKLTDMTGAGYKMAVSPDGKTLAVRQINADEQTVDLYTLDASTKAVKMVAPKVAQINNVAMTNTSVTFNPVGSELTVASTAIAEPGTIARRMAKAMAPQVMVTEEDLKLAVYINGERHIVDPILDTTGNDVNYCWSSLSPDGTRLLFVAHNNAYTSDLDGGNLVNLGPLHAPVWRGNDYVVAMDDKDDGHFFTASDIVIASASDNAVKQVLTDAANPEIKMFPAVSADGSKIAYHTTDGALYVMTIAETSK